MSEHAKPIRVQRKRTKGYKMPPNTVSVCRPGKWGNPFKVGMQTSDVPFIVVKRMTGELGEKLTREQALEAFKIWCEHSINGKEYVEKSKKELRGKNLACFCSLNEQYHADYLLEVVNK